MLLRSMQNTRRLADAKEEAENDALRDDVLHWSSSVAHQSSLSIQCVKPPPPAWIIQPLQTGRHR